MVNTWPSVWNTRIIRVCGAQMEYTGIHTYSMRCDGYGFMTVTLSVTDFSEEHSDSHLLSHAYICRLTLALASHRRAATSHASATRLRACRSAKATYGSGSREMWCERASTPSVV